MIKIHKNPKYVKILNKEILNNNGIIGSRFYSNRCGTFVVTKISGVSKDRHYIYQIIFDKTKAIYNVSKKSIISGEIKDYLYPMISNIGFLGEKYIELKNNDPELCKILRARWKNIINRNYSPNDINYCNYGGKGVTVDPKWYNFCNFYMDITSMPNFNRNEFISGSIDIDKDIKQYNLPINKRIYSKNTVSLITHKNNMKYVNYSNSADKQSKYFIVETNDGKKYLHKNISEFSRSNKIAKQNICKILNKKLFNNSAGGYKYRYPNNNEMQKIKDGILIPGNKIN